MLINKPQFDVDTIKIGSAYHLERKDNRAFPRIYTPCLILRVSPLSVDVVIYDDKTKDIQRLNIGIEEVVKGVFVFTPMKMHIEK